MPALHKPLIKAASKTILAALALYVLIVGVYTLAWVRRPTAILIESQAIGSQQNEIPVLDSRAPVRILAIDGGGIKGLIALAYLVEIERRTGKPISALFDVVAGTSTGSLVATGLLTPDKEGNPKYTASQVRDLYRVIGPNFLATPLWHQLLTLDGLLGPMFLASNLEESLSRIFAPTDIFSNLLKPTVVPTFNLSEKKILLLRSWTIGNTPMFGIRTDNLLSAAVATPAFFPPVLLKAFHGEDFLLADGAVAEDNPSVMAVWEAMTLYPNRSYTLVSLGTGVSTGHIDRTDALRWGFLRWAPPIILDLLHGQSDNATRSAEELHRLFPNTLVSYERFDAKISSDIENPFTATPEKIQKLEMAARQSILQNAKRLDALSKRLVEISHYSEQP